MNDRIIGTCIIDILEQKNTMEKNHVLATWSADTQPIHNPDKSKVLMREYEFGHFFAYDRFRMYFCEYQNTYLPFLKHVYVDI